MKEAEMSDHALHNIVTASSECAASSMLRPYSDPADFVVARLGDMVLGGSGILSDGPNFEPEAIDEFGGDN
jgi:hypothetical protein